MLTFPLELYGLCVSIFVLSNDILLDRGTAMPTNPSKYSDVNFFLTQTHYTDIIWTSTPRQTPKLVIKSVRVFFPDELVASMSTIGVACGILEPFCTRLFGFKTTCLIVALGAPVTSGLYSLIAHYSHVFHFWPSVICLIQLSVCKCFIETGFVHFLCVCNSIIPHHMIWFSFTQGQLARSSLNYKNS